jgi:hypothetical protein
MYDSPIIYIATYYFRHQKALQFAFKALEECQSELKLVMTKTNIAHPYQKDPGVKTKHVALCFHNLAVETEFNGDLDESIRLHQKALEFARNHFGKDDELTKKLEGSLEKQKE